MSKSPVYLDDQKVGEIVSNDGVRVTVRIDKPEVYRMLRDGGARDVRMQVSFVGYPKTPRVARAPANALEIGSYPVTVTRVDIIK